MTIYKKGIIIQKNFFAILSDPDIDSERLRKWLFDNYPNETVFISQITENVNDIFQHLKNHPNFKLGESKLLSFELTRRKETDYMEVQMSPASMIFLGGLAKAISDVIVLILNLEFCIAATLIIIIITSFTTIFIYLSFKFDILFIRIYCCC